MSKMGLFLTKIDCFISIVIVSEIVFGGLFFGVIVSGIVFGAQLFRVIVSGIVFSDQQSEGIVPGDNF